LVEWQYDENGVLGGIPIEEAGINLNLGRNRWMGLIEQSL